MKLTGETKFFIGIIIVTILIIIGAVVFMSRPAPTLSREQLLTPSTYTKGNKEAKTYLVEFSDFQCPACKTYKAAADEVVTKYKDKMVFGYRHFPLSQHPFAYKAAQAAEAAGKQGKFWEIYDLLFENQEKFSDAIFPELAKQLKLDMDKFNKDFNDNEIKNKISEDQSLGNQIGVNSTPTFYLNGKELELFSIGDLNKKVEEEINKNL